LGRGHSWRWVWRRGGGAGAGAAARGDALREQLRRTYLRLGEIVAHDPERKAVELRKKFGGSETLRYDQLLLALGSVSRTLPVPGLSEHAVGFKGLADAIYLRSRDISEVGTIGHPKRLD
jgi:NADH dehydrogenase FAD-containing subunit